MKSILATLALLAALLGFCLWNGDVMERDAQNWQRQLELADHQIRQEQWSAAQLTLQHSYDSWTARQTYLRVVSTHAILDEAEALYRRVIAFASVEDNGELLADLSALRRQLDLLALREQPVLSNIF